MKLKKEIYKTEGFECDYYTKEYNEKGLLILEDKGGYGNWRTDKYIYNNDGNIVKINRISQDYKSEDKLEITYEYDNLNYRITTILKATRNFNEEKWREFDKVISIHEFKFDKGNLISERFNDLENNESHQISKMYEKGLLVTETKTEIGKKLTTEYKYENSVLGESTTYQNGKIENKKIYDSGLLIIEETYSNYNDITYKAFETKYSYNGDNKLTKTEFYGLYNSKMYLYTVNEKVYEDKSIITKVWQAGTNADLGFYNLDELNKYYKKSHDEIKNNNKEYYVLGDNDDYINYEDDKECWNGEYDYFWIEEFDVKNNLNRSTQYNARNEDDVYSRTFYHNEYNDENLIELVICFSINNDYSIEKGFVKKFYYW